MNEIREKLSRIFKDRIKRHFTANQGGAMLYVIRCVDKENHLDVRMANRPTHVEYLKSFGDRLFAAGPTLDAQGEMNGSVVILECEQPEQAEAFAANDPYAKADLFSAVTISPWKKVLP